MKKITLATIAAIVLATGASANDLKSPWDEDVKASKNKFSFTACRYIEKDQDPIAGGSNMRLLMSVNATVDRVIEPNFGTLQSIPIKLGMATGETSLSIGWKQLLTQVSRKVMESENEEEELAYLTLPAAWNQSILAEDAVNAVVDRYYLKTRQKRAVGVDAHDCSISRSGWPLEPTDILLVMINATSQANSNFSLSRYIVYLKNYADKQIDARAEITAFNESVKAGSPKLPKHMVENKPAWNPSKPLVSALNESVKSGSPKLPKHMVELTKGK